MESKGSQDPYVQEAILSVSDINRQMIELQMGINELLRFAPYLLLSLDQREESLIKNCIVRQGSLYLLLDYELTLEDEDYSCNFSDLTIPHIPHHLTDPEAEQLKSSPAYKQESIKPNTGVEPSDNSGETTHVQNKDSNIGPLKEVEDWTLEERQQDYTLKTSNEEKEYDSSPFKEEKPDSNPESDFEIVVES